MRKIENEMIQAIHNNQNLKKDNTSVYSEKHPSHIGINQDEVINSFSSKVFLHGNMIATVTIHPKSGRTGFYVSNGGWFSVTTKSRINAILELFYQKTRNRISLFQKDFGWYFYDSLKGITSERWDGNFIKLEKFVESGVLEE